MNSMTGFGRAEASGATTKISIEIKTVNHRYLDTNIRMPRGMMFLEEDVRNYLRSTLARGHVDVFINTATVGEKPRKVNVDEGLVRGYRDAASRIAAAAGLPDEIDVISLMRMSDVVTFETIEDEDELKAVLNEALKKAVDQLLTARKKEGERIKADLAARAETILTIVDSIEKRAPVVIEEYKEKLLARLKSLKEDIDVDENRFMTEVLYYTDRSCVDEEIVRLKSHVKGLREMLASEEPTGRNFDFIVQEMNREFNTIGSKSADTEMTASVVAGKGEVEKLREQIQNIE